MAENIAATMIPTDSGRELLQDIYGGGGSGDFELYAMSSEYDNTNKIMSDTDYNEIGNADTICILATSTYGEQRQVKAALYSMSTSVSQQVLFKTPRSSITDYAEFTVKRESPHILSSIKGKKDGVDLTSPKVQVLYYRLKQ